MPTMPFTVPFGAYTAPSKSHKRNPFLRIVDAIAESIAREPNARLLRSSPVMAARSPTEPRHDPPDPLPLCSRCLD